MKYLVSAIMIVLVSGCSSMYTPADTNIAVGSLLDEIQIAINEINRNTQDDSSLPPFQSAEVTLSTKAELTTSGSASLVVAGESSSSRIDSNVLTLELVPGAFQTKSNVSSQGYKIAEYVLAAVRAVDSNGFLVLNSLTVEAGLEVVRNEAGGIEVELVGMTVKGGKAKASTSVNNLKLVFAHSEEQQAEAAKPSAEKLLL